MVETFLGDINDEKLFVSIRGYVFVLKLLRFTGRRVLSVVLYLHE